MTRTWHAVACAGGGARGSLQLGAIEAGVLPAHVDCWIGTSTGALTALGMAGGGLTHLQSVYDEVARRGEKTIFKRPALGVVGQIAAVLRRGAMFDPAPLADLIRSSPAPTTPCGVTVYDVESQRGEVVWLDQVDADARIAATLASSSVPGSFPAVRIPGHPGLWVDGGVSAVVPIAPAVRWLRAHAAPEDQLCVTVLMTRPPVSPPVPTQSVIDPITRAIDGLAHQVLIDDLRATERRSVMGDREVQLRLVVPWLPWGSALDFSRVEQMGQWMERTAWLSLWSGIEDLLTVAESWSRWRDSAESNLPPDDFLAAGPVPQ